MRTEWGGRGRFASYTTGRSVRAVVLPAVRARLKRARHNRRSRARLRLRLRSTPRPRPRPRPRNGRRSKRRRDAQCTASDAGAKTAGYEHRVAWTRVESGRRRPESFDPPWLGFCAAYGLRPPLSLPDLSPPRHGRSDRSKATPCSRGRRTGVRSRQSYARPARPSSSRRIRKRHVCRGRAPSFERPD